MSTVEIAPRGPRPPIQVRPLPSCDPPYDDEVEPLPWASANQLALDWPAPGRTWQPPPTPAAEQLARRVASARIAAGTAGDAKLAVRVFVQMFVEVLNGYRPAGHLARLAVPKEAANVVSEAVAGTARVSEIRKGAAGGLRQRRPAPAAAGRPRQSGGAPQIRAGVRTRAEAQPGGFVQRGGCTQSSGGTPQVPAARRDDRPGRGEASMRQFPRRGAVDVMKFHFCEPRPGAVESTILLLTGERTWAMALRMELQGRRWMAAAMRLLL